MKILIIGRRMWDKGKWYYESLRLEFSKQHEVFFYGPGCSYYDNGTEGPMGDSLDCILKVCPFVPDVVLTRFKYPVPELDRFENLFKVNICGDFYDGTWHRPGIPLWTEYYKTHNYDLVLSPTHGITDVIKKRTDVELVKLFPFSVDTESHKKSNVYKDIDASSLGSFVSGMYSGRRDVWKLLKRLEDTINVELGKTFGFNEDGWNDDYIDAINRSKIFIHNNRVFRGTSIKVFEVMSCGTFLLLDMTDEWDELGFVDGKHAVIYEDITDLKDKTLYYLEHEEERETIAAKGMRFVRENHSHQKRVGEFTEIIKEYI